MSNEEQGFWSGVVEGAGHSRRAHDGTTTGRCEGCEVGMEHPTRPTRLYDASYRRLDGGVDRERVRYCDGCVELARVNWTGDLLEIVELTPRRQELLERIRLADERIERRGDPDGELQRIIDAASYELLGLLGG